MRFKRDLLAYLNAYGRAKTGPLVKQLAQFDFQAVRAALIASVPSKKKVDAMNSEKETLWGWPALRDVVRHVPLRHCGTSHVVTQVCSSQLNRLHGDLLNVKDILSCFSRTNRQMA